MTRVCYQLDFRSIVIPAKAGIQKRRCRDICGHSGLFRCMPLNALNCHSRLQAGENGLNKPLDSGFRRNDDGGHRNIVATLFRRLRKQGSSEQVHPGFIQSLLDPIWALPAIIRFVPLKPGVYRKLSLTQSFLRHRDVSPKSVT